MPRLLPSFLLLAAAVSAARGGEIVGYVPGSASSIATFDRFPNGLNDPVANTSTAFVGAGLDLSGVGWQTANPLRSMTLIAPQYVVGAWHVPQGSGLSFVNAAGAVSTFTVEQSYRLKTGGADSDVRLVRLTTAVEPADTGVRPIGVANTTAAGAVGLSALAYGQNPAYNVPFTPAPTPENPNPSPVTPDRRHLGRVVIAQVTTGTFAPPDEPSPTRIAVWNNGTQPGDFRLIPNDSGGPLLAPGTDGRTAILGAHFGVGPDISASSFLPDYVDQINAVLTQNNDPILVLVPVPEPAGLVVAAGVGLTVWRRLRAGRGMPTAA